MLKSRSHLKIGTIALLFSLISGCASVNPVKVYEGHVKSPEEAALILGQNNKDSSNYRVFITIKKVDEKETYNKWTVMQYPFSFYLTPGQHELSIYSEFGYGLQHSELPRLKVNVEPGQVYQIHYNLDAGTYLTRAYYRLIHIGSLVEYNKYIAENPDYVLGSLVPVQKSKFSD